MEFLRQLGMGALRHEEFEQGCAASCNGPYDGKWSKTMIGYGPEDSNFVLEITYNYLVKHYQYGNDLAYIKVRSQAAFKSLMDQGIGSEVEFNVLEARDPDGHTFRVLNEEPGDCGPLASLCLHVSSLEKAAEYWCDLLGFLEVDKGDSPRPFITVSPGGADQATLRLMQVAPGKQLVRGTGYGRVAFSCPTDQLADLQEEVQSRGYTVLTPLVKLDTPGKATVQVVILADPDGHEICFVGDEAFRELSQVDESAPQLLGKAIAKDNSKQWFEERAKRRKTADGKPAAAPAAAAAAPPAAPPAANPGPAAPAKVAAAAAAAPVAASPAAAPAAPKAAPSSPAAAGKAAVPAPAPPAAAAGSSPAQGKKDGTGGKCTSS